MPIWGWVRDQLNPTQIEDWEFQPSWHQRQGALELLAQIGACSIAKPTVVQPNSTVHRTRANRSARR
jgi:hypothetical protein